MHLPPTLQPKQEVQVIAPAGAIKEWESFQAGIEIWRNHGYSVNIPPLSHSSEQRLVSYLAGSDTARWQELYAAWQTETAALLPIRGGYGCMRLLEMIDWQQLPTRSPWLIGFSDITALHWALAAHGRGMGIHAPLLITLSSEPWASQQALFNYLAGKNDHLTLQGEGWISGKVSGRLLPGNLTVATHLLGTRFVPQWENIILALEDIAEPPYKIDRMLTQWRLSGIFKQVKGIGLGRFLWEGDSHETTVILRDRLTDLGIPLVAHLPFGHGGVNFPLPVGITCEIDGDRGTLTWIKN